MFILILSTLSVTYVLYRWLSWYFSPFKDIPLPFSWPLLGHIPYFLNKDSIDVMTKWAKKYEKFGMFRLDVISGESFGGIVLLKPEYHKAVLGRPEKFRRSKFIQNFYPLCGKGLLNSTGDFHRFQRRMLEKTFSTAQIKHFIPVFNRHTSVLVQNWKALLKEANGSRNIAVKKGFTDMSFDIIGEIGFGYQFNSQTNATDNLIVQSIRQQTEDVVHLKARMLLKFLPFLWYLPFGPAKCLEDASQNTIKILDMVVQIRKEKISSGTLTKEEGNDLLSMMMTQMDEKTGEMFSTQLIKDNSYTFFLAGHETTATSLPGILYYLSKYPKLQERCRQEIDNVLEGRELLDSEDLNKIPYTTAFIKESLRLFSTIPENGRISTQDVVIGGHHFPKDTTFFLPVLVVNTDQCSYDYADDFLPERYLDNSDLKTGSSFAFGYGPYSCIGKNFAMQEMKVATTRLLQNFRFTVDPEKEHFTRTQAIALVANPPIEIRMNLL